MTRNFKTGGVPFCWHCSKQLQRKKGGFYFVLVTDPIGNEHRVHQDCLEFVLGDGVKKVSSNYAAGKRKVGA